MSEPSYDRLGRLADARKVVIDNQEKRIAELETALRKVAEHCNEFSKGCRPGEAARLAVISKVVATALEGK